MKDHLRQPCNDCPFRRVAAAGWLGGGTPEAFVAGALADYPLPQDDDWQTTGSFIVGLPCHQTVDYEDPLWREKLDDSQVCIGGLQFCANTFKDPRDPERSRLVRQAGPNPDVFSSQQEFIDHHRSGQARSWKE